MWVFFWGGRMFIYREISSTSYIMGIEDSGHKKRFRCSINLLQFLLLIWHRHSKASFVSKNMKHGRFLMLTVNRDFTALWKAFDFCWFWLLKEVVRFCSWFINHRDHYFQSLNFTSNLILFSFLVERGEGDIKRMS